MFGDKFSVFKAVHSCIVLCYLVLCLLPSGLGGELEAELMVYVPPRAAEWW